MHSIISRRRAVIALGASALAPSIAFNPLTLFAQTPKIHRVAFLTSETEASNKNRLDAFIAALREHGYTEGGNLVLTRHYAGGNPARLPALAEEMARTRPDVIFAPSTISVRAAQKAAGAVPIVFSTAGRPVEDGLVASLRRPGGNITGTTNMTADLTDKRLELLKAAAPQIRRIAVLQDTLGTENSLTSAAKILGVQLLMTDLLRPEDAERRAAEIKKWRADALYIPSGPNNTNNRTLLVEFAARLRLPIGSALKEITQDGGLVSYGPNFEAQYRRAAAYVSRILKGAKPADLPVEQPTVFDLVINLKTARTLGLKIPESMLLRADQVIE